MQNQNKLPAIRAGLIIALGIIAFDSSNAPAQRAEDGILFVDPSRLIIRPGEKTGTLTISDKSDKPHRYTLILIDEVMDERGATQLKDSFNYSAKPMTNFFPKSFLIKPEEEQTVRVVVTRPAALGDGDYHSHLLFHEVPLSMTNEQQLEAEGAAAQKNIYGVAVPVVVQQGRLSGNISISDARLSKRVDKQPRQITIDLVRTGNAESAVKLSVDYAAEGKNPVTVLAPQWIRIYREVGKISRDFTLTDIPENSKGGNLFIYLDEDEELKTAKKKIPFD